MLGNIRTIGVLLAPTIFLTEIWLYIPDFIPSNLQILFLLIDEAVIVDHCLKSNCYKIVLNTWYMYSVSVTRYINEIVR